MNYLYKNRDNSRKLPFDVMNIIYQYADSLRLVKQQIVNKDYNLEEIMYTRILRFLENRASKGLDFYLGPYQYASRDDMYDDKQKQPMLNYYRKNILYYETYRKRICGLDRRYNFYCQRTKIIMDLEASGHKVNSRYSTKQLYKKWLKL